VTSPNHSLDQVQRWFQAVITCPDGVLAGIDSDTARREIDAVPERIGEVVTRSRNLTSIERLEIYANAYHARLIECLRQEFPALVVALGEETFDGFAFGYIQAYPSRSYTLGNLGRSFPQFLSETRPAAEGAAGPDWADFLIDLARVERTYSEVFDGPGVEGQRVLKAGDIADLSPDDWADARLVPVPCLRLLTLNYPVHEYISAVRRKAAAAIPDVSPTFLVVTRREFVVRRWTVSAPEHALLSAIVDGETVGNAIEQVANRPDVEGSRFAGDLRAWFQQWSAAALFLGIRRPHS
jgi:hypothetical protein